MLGERTEVGSRKEVRERLNQVVGCCSILFIHLFIALIILSINTS